MFGFGSSRKKSSGKDRLRLSSDDFFPRGFDGSPEAIDDFLENHGIGKSRLRHKTQRRGRGFYDADVPEGTVEGDEEEEIQKGNINDDKQSTRTTSRTPSARTRTPLAPSRTPSAPTRTPSAPSRTPSAPTRTPSAPSRTPSAQTRTPPAPTRTPSTRSVQPPTRTPSTRSGQPRSVSAPKGDSPTSSPERPKYPDKSFSTGYYIDPYDHEWTRMHSDLPDQLKGVDEDVCNNIAYATGGNNLEHMFSDYNTTGICSIL